MEAIREIRKNKLNFLKTCFIFLMFLVIGLGIAIPGPTLLDLQIAVNCTLEEIGYLLPGRAFGYATGSILGGFLPERFDKQPFIIACFTLSSLFLGLLPLNRTLIGLIATALFKGLFMGITEVCGNVFIIQMWGKNSSPFIQVLYLFFGFGAFVAPLITEPFLLPLIMENQSGNSSLSYTAEDVKIHFPYAYVASYAIIVSIIFTVIYCIRKESKTKATIDDKCEQRPDKSRTRILIAVIFATVYFHFYFGNEITFGSFLTPYAVKSELNLDKSMGAFMTSVFWGTYTFFRLVIIISSDYIGLRNWIIIETVFILVGNVFMVIGTYVALNSTIVWIGTVLMGLGFSSCFALTLGYLQQFFVITGGMVSSFLIAACVGEFIYPYITAQFIEVYPNIFIVVSSFCTICLTIFIIVLNFICGHYL